MQRKTPKSQKPSQVEATEQLKVKGNIIIPDTNILMDDPDVVDSARTGENANNLMVILWQVMQELNDNKTRPDIGHDVREAIRRIKRAQKDPNSNLVIENQTSYSFNGLDKTIPDHRVMAGVLFISKRFNSNDKKSPYFGYQKIKFLTNDEALETLSIHVFASAQNVSVEPLLKNRVKEVKEKPMRRIKLGEAERKQLEKGTLRLSLSRKLNLKKNELVLFLSNFDALGAPVGGPVFKTHFMGIWKGKDFEIIKPDIKISGQGALPDKKGKTNWHQVGAIHMLKDPSIKAIFLQGGAGSGKTFLALAGGLEAKKSRLCKKIVIVRMQIPTDSRYVTGILPGGVEAKHAPWLLPIIDNITVLCPDDESKVPNKSYEEINFAILANHNIFVQPLDYIKGSSFRYTFIIVEEAQDLNRRQIKQIITRCGEGTRVIFTGDIKQISEDDRHINRHTSGLPYAATRLEDDLMVGVVHFAAIVRGELAELAEKRLT